MDVFEIALGDLFGGFDAVEIGHADVEDGDVGFELGGLSDGLAAVFGFADDGEFGLLLDEKAQAATDEGVVVGEQDSNFTWIGAHAGATDADALAPASTGSSARMIVRVPGRDSMLIVPPRRLTRSSMPRRPIPRVRLGSKPPPSSSILTLIEFADCFRSTVTFFACAWRFALLSDSCTMR